MRQDPNSNWKQFEQLEKHCTATELNVSVLFSFNSMITVRLIAGIPNLRTVLFGKQERYVSGDPCEPIDTKHILGI